CSVASRGLHSFPTRRSSDLLAGLGSVVTASGGEKHTMLKVGKQAPEFTAQAYIRGEKDAVEISLSDYRGQWVVLFFYPRDFTFVCPTEIQAFGELHDEFTAEKAVVLGASTDSYYSHKAWFETDERLQGVRYPVLADTSHAIAEAYGILLEDGTALRGTLIIDPEGVLRHVVI